MVPDDIRITVLHEWNGSQQAFARLSDLQDFHHFQPHGAPKPLMHAYVLCSNLTGDDFPHHCDRTRAPHRLLVCILKSHSTGRVYAEMARRASDQRGRDVGEHGDGVRPPSSVDDSTQRTHLAVLTSSTPLNEGSVYPANNRQLS